MLGRRIIVCIANDIHCPTTCHLIVQLGLHYRIATPLGGLATPPGTYSCQFSSVHSCIEHVQLTRNGTLLKKNDHLPRFLHSSLNVSRSNSSPIGIPQPASSHS